MRKLLNLFVVFLFSASMMAQGETASSVFISMPDDILVTLDSEQRTELVAHPDSATLSIVTAIGGDVERLALTADYLSIKTSDIGKFEMKLLPLVNNTHVIAVMNTVCGPACDSRVDFYTTSWEPLSSRDMFPMKDANWFLNITSNVDPNVASNLESILNMSPIKLSFSAEDNNIKAEYDIEKYLSADDYAAIEPYIVKNPVVLKWNKSAYEL